MRVGFIVDGDAEFASLGLVFAQLSAPTGDELLQPLLANIQPYAPPAVIAKSCLARLRQLTLKSVDLVVVLLDREQRKGCPPALASELASALRSLGNAPTVEVVVKNRTYENWLVADLAALSAQKGRFKVSAKMKASIEPDKADNVDALKMLKGCCVKKSYHKILDSKRIMSKAQVDQLGKNSRSFRRFMRCVRFPDYSSQSRVPR